jgi:outer membrane immunogenic protein
MKHKLIILFVCLLSGNAFAQYQLDQGKMQFNAGVGLSSWGIPVYVGLDYGLTENVSVGGEATFRSYNEKVGSLRFKSSIIGIAANGNYHFGYLVDASEEWDLYAGLNLGFYIWSTPNNYPGTSTSGLGLGAQAGVRYYVNEKLALNLEGGGGSAFSGGKLGISLLLK